MQKIGSMHHQIYMFFLNYNKILDESEDHMFQGYQDLEKESETIELEY